MSRKKTIPVYCFNEHNEAYYYWNRSRIEGDLYRPMDLIHIDAHDDMARPRDFSESLYPNCTSNTAKIKFYRRFAATQLTIADFILPAVLCGIIKNVYFVYPKWRNFKPNRKSFTICSAFGEGKILKYGIRIKKNANPLLLQAIPDLKRFQYVTGIAEELPQRRKVILDIDLDYFVCCDSITNHFDYELEITRSQYENRERVITDKTLPFSGIEIAFNKRGDRHFAHINRKKVPEVRHFPAEEEIEQEIDTLMAALLKKKITPAVVTICRSCDSGYCPKEQAQFVEQLLINKLQPLLSS